MNEIINLKSSEYGAKNENFSVNYDWKGIYYHNFILILINVLKYNETLSIKLTSKL